MSKIKNGALDQYGAEPFEQLQFGTAGGEGVKDELIRVSRLHWDLSRNEKGRQY